MKIKVERGPIPDEYLGLRGGMKITIKLKMNQKHKEIKKMKKEVVEEKEGKVE